jgi:hypothetical protein
MRDHVVTRNTFNVQIFSFSLTACDANFKLKSKVKTNKKRHTEMSNTSVALKWWWKEDKERMLDLRFSQW